MLPLLLALMLPANFVALNATGPVLFDGSAIAFVTLNNTEAYVRLPLIPGNHSLIINGQKKNISFFDYICDFEDLFECNVTAYEDIVLPFHLSCGTHPYGELYLKKGETQTIRAGGACKSAYIQIGDFNETQNFIETFKNYVVLSRPGNVSVSKDNDIILKKYGNSYVGFSELKKGTYWVSSDTGLQGKLIIEPKATSVYGYALSALVVMSAIALLLKG